MNSIEITKLISHHITISAPRTRSIATRFGIDKLPREQYMMLLGTMKLPGQFHYHAFGRSIAITLHHDERGHWLSAVDTRDNRGMRDCLNCGELFQPTNTYQDTCAGECKKTHLIEKQRARIAALKLKQRN